jgi:hypothetical protein
MIRQAHTYLVGALSGVVVIGIAIAAFVVLVSAQVFHDLPIPALSSSDQKAAAVSQGKAVTAPGDQAVATTGAGATPRTSQGNTNANPNGGGRNGAKNTQPQAHHQAAPATPTQEATGPAEVVETTPTANTGGNEGSTSGGGKSGGSHSSQPSSSSHSPSSTTSGGGNVSGGNSTSSSGTSGSGGGNSTPTTTSGNTGGSTTTGAGGGTTTTSPPATPVTTAKPSETITEGIDGAVGTVDEATGGTLSESGVTHVTEEVVKGVAGPESVVGKTVDGVGEVVGGLLGGNGQ